LAEMSHFLFSLWHPHKDRKLFSACTKK